MISSFFPCQSKEDAQCVIDGMCLEAVESDFGVKVAVDSQFGVWGIAVTGIADKLVANEVREYVESEMATIAE